MPITLKEISAEKRGEGWYERSIQLTYDEVNPPYEAMLPTITHYIGKEKDMEANIDKEVKEIMSKFLDQKKPNITASLVACEKKANDFLKVVG
ncbi:MAG: hypothetical protein PHO03_06285 [Candidatus Omnitrophica bacterium]|nr:hypothetical protein [Candidatus Omnitrophota bacterium]